MTILLKSLARGLPHFYYAERLQLWFGNHARCLGGHATALLSTVELKGMFVH
eukprot:m.6912 g.6912  ORF g.6912 m.6912 type:complete len:52 (+) comp8640_c0_seq1:777-932(+)